MTTGTIDAASDPGWREAQEDAHHADPRGLLVVADGIGGDVGGGEAARAAVEAIVTELSDAPAPDAIADAFEWAARQIRERSAGGTTLIVVQVSGDQATIAWVGDSRVYLVRGSEDAALLTEDHLVQGGLERWLPDAPCPDQLEVALSAGDVLVVCTDGVSDVLDEAEIARTVREAIAPAGALVEAALDAGTSDNCTALTWAHGPA